MTLCEAAARREFEALYTVDPHIWLVRNADQSYRYPEIQDAWVHYFKGWTSGIAWVSHQ